MPRKKSGEATTKKSTARRNTTTTKRTTTRAAKTAAAKSVAMTPVVPYTEAQIRERAYFIHLERRGSGDPVSDWLQAERELLGGTLALRD